MLFELQEHVKMFHIAAFFLSVNETSQNAKLYNNYKHQLS